MICVSLRVSSDTRRVTYMLEETGITICLHPVLRVENRVIMVHCIRWRPSETAIKASHLVKSEQAGSQK